MTARDIDTSSELWRRECEARHMLKLPGRERVEALGRIATKRGDAAANQLAEDIRALRNGREIQP